MESPDAPDELIDDLEDALKEMSDTNDDIEHRIGPAIAALLHSARTKDIDDPETMASLIRSLVDEEHPVTFEDINRIRSFEVMEDIRDCGINIPEEELTEIIENTIKALRAQILERDEAERLEQEVQNALKARDLESISKQNVIGVKPTRSRRTEGAPSEISRVEFQSLVSLHAIGTPTTSGSRRASYVSIGASSATSFDMTKEEVKSNIGQSMTTTERKQLASRITTSIMAQDKGSQSGAPMPHSGLRVHLAPEEQKTDEEKSD